MLFDGRRKKPPYFGTLVSIRFQRCMPALRAMPRANLTDPANPLISGATGSMSKRTFANLSDSRGSIFSRRLPRMRRACSMALMQHADRPAA